MASTKNKSGSPTFLDPALAPWVLVSQVYWMSYKLLERRLYRLGVSTSQARVLAVIHTAGEPIKPSAVAILLFQETQSITGILNRLEGRGWIARAPDPADKRAVRISLSLSGTKLAEQIDEISRALYQDVFRPALTAPEQRAVTDGLRKVRARAFNLPETDFKLRKARQYPVWSM